MVKVGKVLLKHYVKCDTGQIEEKILQERCSQPWRCFVGQNVEN